MRPQSGLKTKLLSLWEKLRTSFWFVPTLMAVGSLVLALFLLWLDERIGDPDERRWLYAGGPEAARDFLSTIAASMITVTGVTFSITIVVLSLASQQLGPRLLRTFMSDRGTQFVLGTFVATFVFCITVLRAVRKFDDEPFVPHASITGAFVLAMTSLGVLIYFIHHVSSFIQAPAVVARVAADLRTALESLFPHAAEADPQEQHQPVPTTPTAAEYDRDARPIMARSSGYLQAVAGSQLLQTAVARDVVLRLSHRPGHFVVAGLPMVWVWPADRSNEDLIDEVLDAFIIGYQRTLTQDIEFAVQQLVEIAVRALSPSLNDPFTANSCLNWLGEAICHLAVRPFPSPEVRDEQGKVRIIAYPLTLAGIINTAFNQIRQAAMGHPAVLIRILETITTVAPCLSKAEDRNALMRQVVATFHAAQRTIQEESDLKDIERRYLTAVRAVETTSGQSGLS